MMIIRFIAIALLLLACEARETIEMREVPVTEGVDQPEQQLPHNHPPMNAGGAGQTGAGQAPAPSVEPPAPSRSALQWAAPSAWVEEQPSSNMRMAQWQVPAGDESLECAMFHFPGGGTVEGNITRWVNQFESTSSVERDSTETNGVPTHTVSVTGTFQGGGRAMGGPDQPQADAGLFGAIFETSAGLDFLKCTGPAAGFATVGDQLDAFVGSIRPR